MNKDIIWVSLICIAMIYFFCGWIADDEINKQANYTRSSIYTAASFIALIN